MKNEQPVKEATLPFCDLIFFPALNSLKVNFHAENWLFPSFVAQKKRYKVIVSWFCVYLCRAALKFIGMLFLVVLIISFDYLRKNENGGGENVVNCFCSPARFVTWYLIKNLKLNKGKSLNKSSFYKNKQTDTNKITNNVHSSNISSFSLFKSTFFPAVSQISNNNENFKTAMKTIPPPSINQILNTKLCSLKHPKVALHWHNNWNITWEFLNSWL